MKLGLQLPRSIALHDHQVHTDDDFKYCFPQREYILELLPLEFREDEFIENSDLRKPHNIIEEIVVVTAYSTHKLKDLKADGMLFIFKNLVHLAVFIQEKQEAKDFSAIRYVVLNRLGSGH